MFSNIWIFVPISRMFLSGKNNITYTFSKTLGGNNLGVFSYYLTSPFMLLCVFFKKTQLHAFFDVLVMLKLSTASFTFCWFLTGRFRKRFPPAILP